MLSKIFSLVLAIYYFFSPLTAPSTDNVITALDEDSVKLTFAAWADLQVSNYMISREPPVRAAGEDLANAKTPVDALLVVGDIAENGLECEYEVVTEDIIDCGVSHFLMATGNHDVRLRKYSQVVSRFTEFQNNLNKASGSDLVMDKLHYSYEINGYAFIIMGTDRTEFEEAYFNEAQLTWLDETLKAKAVDGKPVFVVIHQVLKNTHGLPDTWGSSIDSKGSVGEQSDELYEIMNRYNNVIMISGHLHTGFGQYTYQKIGNFDSINLPSVGIENKDGEYNDRGIGFMVEVYGDEVVFRARNFAEGKYLPDYDIRIELD